MKSKSITMLGSALVLLVAGCASQPSDPILQSEQIIKQRAQERWDASRKGDFEKAFSFTTPSYRAVTDIKVFRNATSGSQNLVSADVLSVKCETEASCAAKVRFQFHSPITLQNLKQDIIENHFDETWVKEDGNWWLFKQ